MAGYIRNDSSTAPCAENIWSTCSQEFSARFGAIVVLKNVLYGCKTAYISLHNFSGDFLRDIVFNPSRSDQYLWMSKSDEYTGY